MTDVHPRISANSLCLGDVGLDVLADRWRDLAPRRIGLVSDQLLDGDFDHLRRIIANGSYVVETIAHVFTDSLTPDPDGWVRPRAQLSRLITLAAQISARSIYMLSGNRGGMAWEPAADAFAAALAPCIRQAHDAGIALAVEPAMPLIAGVHIAHTLRDATTLAEIAGIGLCIDVFACWTEAGLDALLDRAAPLARVVQISDYVPTDRALPCRAVPGDGVIPLAPIIRRLIDNGYVGGFDLELIGPRIEQEGHVAATRRAMLALGRILADCGA